MFSNLGRGQLKDGDAYTTNPGIVCVCMCVAVILGAHGWVYCRWPAPQEEAQSVLMASLYSHDAHAQASHDAVQLSSTHSFTLRSYSALLSLYSLAASLLAGLLGLGSHNRDCIDVSTAATSYIGLQLFCRMSKQI